MRIFAFVHRQKAEFAVKILCRVCRVSTSGYYGWAARQAAGPSENERAEAELIESSRLVHAQSRGRYGEPRVTAQLARDGMAVNHKRVERLMARDGLQGRSPITCAPSCASTPSTPRWGPGAARPRWPG